MILIDYNGIALANIFVAKTDIEENLIRHMILNSIRLYRKKFKAKYGEVVICCDAGGNWRNKIYSHYKAHRKTDRDADTKMDWEKIFKILNQVRDDIVEHFPYKVIHIHGCEADDIIGALAFYTQEFGQHEEVMIISTDHDFIQLQKHKNVVQYSPVQKKAVMTDHPRTFLFEHICRGDAGDGVPNVLSADNVFVEKIRQTPLSKKKLDIWKAANANIVDRSTSNWGDDLRKSMGEEIYRNYLRNKKMIDLSETPPALVAKIINSFEEQEIVPANKIMPFLIKKRCRGLLEVINDFID